MTSRGWPYPRNRQSTEASPGPRKWRRKRKPTAKPSDERTASADTREASARGPLIDLAKQLIDLRIEGRIAEFAELLTQDCEVRIIGLPSGAAAYPSVAGRDAVLRKLREYQMEFDVLDIEVRQLVLDGDDLAVIWNGQIHYRASGPSELVEGIAHLHFRNGQLARYTNIVTIMSVEGS